MRTVLLAHRDEDEDEEVMEGNEGADGVEVPMKRKTLDVVDQNAT